MNRGSSILRRLALAIVAIVLLLLVVLAYVNRRLSRAQPAPQFAADQDHFFYASIGTEDGGLPYWIWLVLPRVFPEYLPGPGGYASIGLDTREGHDMPIGMSKVVSGGVPRVGINCAFCHTARVRLRPGEISTIVPAAPGHQINWERYRRFLIACASDPRFTADTLLAEIDRNYTLPPVERMLYKWVIVPQTRRALLSLQPAGRPGDAPEIGAGRSAAVGIGGLPDAGSGDPLRGASDMMPIWRVGGQRPAFYWDGMNTKLEEVVTAWALASGASPAWIDRDSGQSGGTSSLARIRKYLDATPPPKYPLPLDAPLVLAGQQIFATECASCHAPGGPRTGAVIPVEEVGTDRTRLDAWSADAASSYNRAFAGKPWAFSSFRKTNGFVAPPLEGLWIRAPYLHNGSVPSLAALLSPPEQRPRQFWRGSDLFDATAVGFVASGTEAERLGSFYDTAIRGNGNGGHTFGTQLEPDRKRALLEFLKGL